VFDGESGCGKSTMGKVLIGLINQKEKENFGVDKLSGYLNFNMINNEIDYLDTTYKELTALRKNVQMVFQNPRSALNLKMPVIKTLLESAKIGNPKMSKEELLKIIYDKVIKTEFLHKKVKFEDFTNESKMLARNGSLSGGERRRVCIAKVMCMNPDLIVADEPLASLDASIKNNILQYFIKEWNDRKKTDNPLTLILISHDIGVVSNVCNRVIIMYGDLINKRGDIIDEISIHNNHSIAYIANNTNIMRYKNQC
jgi:ABC-type glutathione transport system ATPase component